MNFSYSFMTIFFALFFQSFSPSLLNASNKNYTISQSSESKPASNQKIIMYGIVHSSIEEKEIFYQFIYDYIFFNFEENENKIENKTITLLVEGLLFEMSFSLKELVHLDLGAFNSSQKSTLIDKLKKTTEKIFKLCKRKKISFIVRGWEDATTMKKSRTKDFFPSDLFNESKILSKVNKALCLNLKKCLTEVTEKPTLTIVRAGLRHIPCYETIVLFNHSFDQLVGLVGYTRTQEIKEIKDFFEKHKQILGYLQEHDLLNSFPLSTLEIDETLKQLSVTYSFGLSNHQLKNLVLSS